MKFKFCNFGGSYLHDATSVVKHFQAANDAKKSDSDLVPLFWLHSILVDKITISYVEICYIKIQYECPICGVKHYTL